jgi:dTDP-4-amino-4,6-dideoxygalactose transaminase
MDQIVAIARRHDLKVVEDAAHALPTRYRGRLVGTLDTDATVYSFYATKTLATGEGGMLVTRDPAIAARCRKMRLHGIDRDAFDRYVANRPRWYYEVVAPGFKYNMTDIAAAMGIHQLRKALRLRDQREAMATRYRCELADLPLLQPCAVPPGDLHAWHLYVVRLQPEAAVSRDRLIEELSARGIGTSVHFIPLHLHPYWRDTYQLQPEDYPKALAAYQSAVSLPLYTRMTPEDQGRVIQAIREVLAA